MARSIVSGRPVFASTRRGGALLHLRAVLVRWFDRVNGSARPVSDIDPADMTLIRRIAEA